MCGLLGFVGAEIPEHRLNLAMQWIARRGPDGQRVWKSDDYRVGLLHARLGIVDRDPRADQPFLATDNKYAVAFVGEIYNHRELKNGLRDYEFRTESDTEVILALYERRGVAGLNELKGMFTICIVDAFNRRVILARDPIGKKPLFLSRLGGIACFGSSVIPLVAMSGQEPAIDVLAQEQYWRDAHVTPERTVIQGISPVQPGMVLELDWSGREVRSGCCAPEPALLFTGEDNRDIEVNVRELLRTAVKRRLDNNPRPTSLLSGGVDSTVVTSYGAAVLASDNHSPGAQLDSITLGAVIPGMNDELFARYAARRLRLRNKVVRVGVRELGGSIVRAIDLQDEPLGMPSFYVLMRLVEEASRYGRILMTGDGGDEVFLGYGKTSDWITTVTPAGTPDSRRSGCGAPVPAWMSAWGRTTVGTGLLGHMLPKADRASAEQGVELRCPLLDWDVVSYARSLPFEVLLRNNTNKALLKSTLTGWPHWFLERRKLGFVFNLRWIWGAMGYTGLREMVDTDTVVSFGSRVAEPLRKPPALWTNVDVFSNFSHAWKLMVWNRFLARLRLVTAGSGPSTGVATAI